MKMQEILKSLLPPLILDFLRKLKYSKYGWHGNYKSWDKAKKHSTGYDSEVILQKVKDSLLKVKAGKAIFERDGVLFNEIQYSWPLLAGLMYAAAKSKGVLKVCDFGGSLGTTYFQNKKFLDGLKEVSWCIVEQKHFVDVGKNDFEDERLKFYYDINSCKKEKNPKVLVLSSVLQYIEKPFNLLSEINLNDFNIVLVDRTPFSAKKQIKIQVVPPSIYQASYPCWFFEKAEFLRYFENNKFKIIEEFDAIDGKAHGYEFKGFIFEKMAI